MASARIRGVALVLVVDGLTSVSEENCVTASALWLQAPNGEVLLNDGVRIFRLGQAIEGIDFLAQHGPFERTTSLPFFSRGQPARQDGVRKEQRSEMFVGETWLAIVLVFKVSGNPRTLDEGACVEP